MTDNGRTLGNGDEEFGDEDEGADLESGEYDAMLRLERLETLEEDMMELGVATLDEVRQRIAQLHQQLDDAD